MDTIDQLLKKKSGIRLDIGGGAHPQAGYVNMDILPLPEVDIVHDLEEFPWPIPDEAVLSAVASHVLEHISPIKGVFLGVMNELWRVLKPGGQFAFVVPYGVNELYVQDPTHCNPINQTTMYYFDPDPEGRFAGQALYRFYQPKPWKIERMAGDRNGTLEVLLSKRLDDRSFHEDAITDNSNLVKELVDESHQVPKHLVG